MEAPNDALERYSVAAIHTAAEQLGMDPLTLARQLQEGQIARLVRLLNSACPQVASPGLRRRMEDTLSTVTDGKMPMFEAAGSELDWAMGEMRQRRLDRERQGKSAFADEDEG